MRGYLNSTLRKKRSVICHCNQIGFDFTKFVDTCFRNFFTDFLHLGSLLDFMTIFVAEGRKSMFRFTYAICKVNKDHIKQIRDAKLFNAKLGEISKA